MENLAKIKLFEYIDQENVIELQKLLKDVKYNEKSKRLIDFNGLSFDCLFEYCDTPLHLATRKNKIEVIKILVKSFRKMTESTNEDNLTPAGLALKIKNLESFKLLCNSTVVTMRNQDSKNLLHLAVEQEAIEFIKYLLGKDEEKINLNSKTRDFNSPLHLAALTGNKDVLKLLLSQKPDVNAKNKYGDTALHAAIRKDKTNAAKLLIKSSCNINELNENLDSPLHLATAKKNLEIIKKLVKRGAKKHIKNRENNNPLEIAMKYSDSADNEANCQLILEALVDGRFVGLLNNLKYKFTGKQKQEYQFKQSRRFKTQF